jgi:hypothetical protein
VDKILQNEATLVKMKQLAMVNEYGIKDRSGALRKMLEGHFDIQDFDGGPRLTLTYVKHMRFLDMKRVTSSRRGFFPYNRIIFGRVYNDTYRRIRDAYRDSLRGEITELVKEATEQLEIDE